MGPLDDKTRESEIVNNLLYTKYTQELDRDSAYEFLTKKVAAEEKAEADAKEAMMAEKQRMKDEAAAEKQRLKEIEAAEKAKEKERTAKEKQVKRAVKNVASSATGTIGREIGKTIGGTVGGSFGKRLGGNVGASLGRGLLSTLFK